RGCGAVASGRSMDGVLGLCNLQNHPAFAPLGGAKSAGNGDLTAGFRFNHLAGLFGVDMHEQVQDTLRLVYRNTFTEPLLLLCVVVQWVSGMRTAWGLRAAFAQLGLVERIQVGSGLVLGSFVVIHVAAVLTGRWVTGLDTNFYFAAAGMHVEPFAWFFGPYYFLGVSALGIHLSCAVWWRLGHWPNRSRRWMAAAVAATGVLCAALLVLLLAGLVVPVQVPQTYRASFAF
ncbi:MAG: hypothetical protein U1D25_19700, partial [Hydrogenophaga sp.]|uniref:hypothetical protein n=1 Tax=Hydrogenophaga sp. TaxID=1904254 RepID=UPI002ABB6D4E